MKNCTYLGLVDDNETAAGFPSERNLCYRKKKPIIISFDHQIEYCLTTCQDGCPYFQEKELSSRAANQNSFKWIAWVLLAMLLLTGIMIYSQSYRKNNLASGYSEILSRINLPSPSVEIISVAITTKYPKTTATAGIIEKSSTPICNGNCQTPSPTVSIPTLTPEPVKVYALDTIIEGSPEILIHRMEEGEGLTKLAELHQTSAESIQRINYHLPIPAWVGWVIVIPLNTVEVSSLPAFETYQVEGSRLTLRLLAQLRDLNLEDLSRYNQVGPDDLLPMDGWLLIPHPQESAGKKNG